MPTGMIDHRYSLIQRDAPPDAESKITARASLPLEQTCICSGQGVPASSGFPSNLPPQAALPTVRGLYYASSYQHQKLYVVPFPKVRTVHGKSLRLCRLDGWMPILPHKSMYATGYPNIAERLDLRTSGTSSPIDWRGVSMYADAHLTGRARDL